MPTLSKLEKLNNAGGSTSGKKQDIAYRAGLVIQLLGAAILAVLYPLGNPFYSLGIMLFEVGVLLSAASLIRKRSWVGKAIGTTVLAGIALQVSGFYAPEEYAGILLLSGIGLVCAGAAGIAGKEACCTGYREGWILMLVLFLLVAANLFGRENQIFNAVGFSALFLILLSLAGKKLRQPLAADASSICGSSSGGDETMP